MADMLSASDVLDIDWNRIAQDKIDDGVRREAQRLLREMYSMRAPELHVPLPSEPVEIREKNVVTDPNSWLNRGLNRLAGDAASVILGEPSGNDVVDMGVANVPLAGAGAILAAGGMPGVVDITGLPSFVKRAPQGFRILADMMKNPEKHSYNVRRLAAAFQQGGEAFKKELALSRKYNEADLRDMVKADKEHLYVPEESRKNIIEQKHLNELLGSMTDEERKILLGAKNVEADNWLKNLDTYAEYQRAEAQRIAEENVRKLADTKRSTQNLSTFTSNPKKAAQEMVDQNLSIEDYLGDNLEKIRPGQRKQVEDQLRKLGMDIPEEVVEQAPVVVKKEKPKEVQLPKSEKQRLAAIETAQKTWKKKPNDVFKSIDKGRTPEDYFKGAENIPEDFADRYSAHVAEKEGRRAEQAAQQEAARVQAEIDRQNAQATQKQLERRAAEEEARDAIARERERMEQERALAELFAHRNSPEGVLESGWKPSEHPPMGGNPYPDYAVSDLDRRNHFFRDSVATQILKGFSPENPVTGEKMKDLFGPNPAKVVRHRGTNYDQMMANFYRELEDAKKAGRYTGPTSGADAMSEQMYRDSFKKQYEDLFSKAIDELFFRRPTTR